MFRTRSQSNAALIIRHHVVKPGEPDELLRLLLQLCAYHVDVRPLSSGKSGAVSGEVCFGHFLSRWLDAELGFVVSMRSVEAHLVEQQM
jgi:hypothetical protein